MNPLEQVTLRLPSPSAPSVGTSLTVLLGGEGFIETTAWFRSASKFLEPEAAVHAIVEVEDPGIATAEHLGDNRWKVHTHSIGQCTIHVRLGSLVGHMALSVVAPEPAQGLELVLKKTSSGVQMRALSRHQSYLSRRAKEEHGLCLSLNGDGFALGPDGEISFPQNGNAFVEARIGGLQSQGVVGSRLGVLTLLSVPAPQRRWIAGKCSALSLETSRSDGVAVDLSRLHITSSKADVASAHGCWIHCKAAGETTLTLDLDGLVLEQRLVIEAPRIEQIAIQTNAGRGSMFHGILYMSPGEDLDLRVCVKDEAGMWWVPDAEGFVEVTSSSAAVEIVLTPYRGLLAVAEGSAIITARCAGHTTTLEIRVNVPDIQWF